MDTLTFNSPIIYRHLTFSEAKKAPIQEIVLERALEGLEMSMSQVYIHRNRERSLPLTYSQRSSLSSAYFLVATTSNPSRGSVPSQR